MRADDHMHDGTTMVIAQVTFHGHWVWTMPLGIVHETKQVLQFWMSLKPNSVFAEFRDQLLWSERVPRHLCFDRDPQPLQKKIDSPAFAGDGWRMLFRPHIIKMKPKQRMKHVLDVVFVGNGKKTGAHRMPHVHLPKKSFESVAKFPKGEKSFRLRSGGYFSAARIGRRFLNKAFEEIVRIAMVDGRDFKKPTGEVLVSLPMRMEEPAPSVVMP